MASRDDCIDDISRRLGGRKSRRQVEDELDAILEAADGYQREGMSAGNAYARARDERLNRESERAMLRRKQERENALKEIELHRWTDNLRKNAGITARLTTEAKLVGVNTPFFRSQDSIAARWNMLHDKWTGDGGLEGALERAGLFKLFASGTLDREVGRELAEFDKGPHGKPGITKNEQAKAIAEILHNADKQAMTDHNMAGGFIRSYSGHVAKVSHDPDAIRFASAGGRNRPLVSFDMNPWAKVDPERDAATWIADVLKGIDVKRTFGSLPEQKIKDILRQMWASFIDGDHFEYVSPSDDPIYANVAQKAAAHRELHWKSFDDWYDYNEKYGLYRNLREAKMRSYETLAKQTALVGQLGTKPGETFENWIAYIKNSTKGTPERQEFDKFEHALKNELAWLDGSANRPTNRLAARTIRNWMVWERMSMLGRVLFTHIAGLPTKTAELNYWGVPLARRYGALIEGITRGAEGSDKREIAARLWASNDASRSYIASRYDAADTPGGLISRAENRFFKLTGVPTLLDNERVNSEQVMASHIGAKRGQAWADIGASEQRVLRAFGIEEPEWKALNKVEWTRGRGMDGDHAYLTPSDALKLSDDNIRDYLKERPQTGQIALGITDQMIARTREDLAQRLATAYGERGRYAMFMPSVRAKARMFGQTQKNIPWLYKILQLTAQFRLWPMEMIYKTWGREVYGRQGDPVLGRVAAGVEMAVASAVFGMASNALREASQGQDPISRMQHDPGKVVLDGLLRSGAGTIFGDYLFGEFDRHGRSAAAQILGPTFGKIDQVMDLIHGGGPQERHPGHARAADLMAMVRENTPFVNLYFTSMAWQYLVVYRLQEWLNPGYLERMEKRMKDQHGTEFWLRPTVAR